MGKPHDKANARGRRRVELNVENFCAMSIFIQSSPRSIFWMALPILVLLILWTITRRREEAVIGESPKPTVDRTNRQYWKGGVFYVNADDPALLVKKRSGLGWTFNFGHWASWIILFILLSIPWLLRFMRGRS